MEKDLSIFTKSIKKDLRLTLLEKSNFRCVVGIPVFMIKKTEYEQTLYHQNLPFYGGIIVDGIVFFNHKQWNTNDTSNQYYSCCC